MPASGNVLWVVAAILAALGTGTLIRFCWQREAPPELAQSRLNSLRSWWIVAGVAIAVALLGTIAASVVFAAVSLLAMREFRRIGKLGSSRSLACLVYGLVPVSYLLLGLGLHAAFVLFIPICGVAVLSAGMICAQRTNGYLADAAGNYWGLALTTYLLGHVVLLFGLGDASADAAVGSGWFLLLVTLTESSDIMQALSGRRFGNHKLAPIVSPNKTWEGLAGGLLSTVLLAAFLGPWLTPLTTWQGAAAGFVTTIAGLFGDLNISAIKRDAGVKDSGTLLPGQGGILDRVDSLTFTAPAFYYYVLLLER